MRTRIISAAVGVAILLVVLYFHAGIVFPLAVSAIVAIMLFELLKAVELTSNKAIFIAAELCGIAVPLLYSLYFRFDEGMNAQYLDPVIPAAILGVTLLCAFIVFFTWLRHHKEIGFEKTFFVLAVMVLVPQSMSTAILLDRRTSLFYLCMALCGAWIADTGAYFTGITLGKHKLCPEISPKKTVEGLAGGIVTTGLVYSIAFCIHSGFDVTRMLLAFFLGAVCAVIGTLGDLSASMIKRQVGIKDYGNIMPGHGGIMDRFDSVLFVLPVFYAFVVLVHGLLADRILL